MDFHALFLFAQGRDQELSPEQQKLIFGREGKRGTEYFLRFQSRTVCTQKRTLDAYKSIFIPKAGECNAVSGRKTDADQLLCLYQLCDGGRCVSRQEKRTAAAGDPF